MEYSIIVLATVFDDFKYIYALIIWCDILTKRGVRFRLYMIENKVSDLEAINNLCHKISRAIKNMTAFCCFRLKTMMVDQRLLFYDTDIRFCG